MTYGITFVLRIVVLWGTNCISYLVGRSYLVIKTSFRQRNIRVRQPVDPSACCALEQDTLCCITSFDPGTNGYLREQVRKQGRQFFCEWPYTIQGIEKDIQMDQDVPDGQIPSDQGRYLSKSSGKTSVPGRGLKQWLYLYLSNDNQACVPCADYTCISKHRERTRMRLYTISLAFMDT